MLDEPNDGFIIYQPEHLRKMNTLRATKSMVGKHDVPILNRGQVMYTTEAEMKHQPASCYNCHMYQSKLERCMIHSNEIVIKKFVDKGPGGKEIEYWPCCSYWDHGEPCTSNERNQVSNHDGDSTGLIWINAPKVGLPYSGACCGGSNGGDDCDFYLPYDADEKWDSTSGFCRVLQGNVGPGDVCSAWQDDDLIPVQVAQNFLKEDNDADDK